MPRLFAAAFLVTLACGTLAPAHAQERVDLSELGTIGELTYVLGFDAAQGAQQDSANFERFVYDDFARGFRDGVSGAQAEYAYKYGLQIGTRLGSDTTLSMSPDLFLAAFQEGLAFATSQLDDTQRRSVMSAVQDTLMLRTMRARAADDPEAAQMLADIAAGQQESDSLLAAAALRPGADVRASGLVIIQGKPGTGPAVTMNDRVRLHYTGTFADGTEFDASGETPAEFSPKGVVAGFGEGIVGMRAGGTRTLIMPPNLAYGMEGRPGGIPPNKALTFEVEVVEIVTPPGTE